MYDNLEPKNAAVDQPDIHKLELIIYSGNAMLANCALSASVRSFSTNLRIALLDFHAAEGTIKDNTTSSRM
jgi:hypothetical protein